MIFKLCVDGRNLEFKEFFTEWNPHRLDNSFRSWIRKDSPWMNSAETCRTAGYKIPTMPELIEARIYANENSPLWHSYYDSISSILIGRTRSSNFSRNGGSIIAAYLHEPLNIFSDCAQEWDVIPNIELNVINLGFDTILQKCLPQNIINYDILKNSISGLVPLKEALKHPQLVPFIGSKEIAERYLERFQEVYKSKEIGIWHWHTTSNINPPHPLIRPLSLSYNGDIMAYWEKDLGSRFFGIKSCDEEDKITKHGWMAAIEFD